ncbi:hypothetical protein UFOVP462_26 [uncultured Caudovirales phage]|uniref:Uncharacterized protein n=1 Tax=uncultured Caudovirales phage TaxID=2100421 RepID=A0A6J5MDE9_9CAUD|nr:hypothetical protein UFOVP462_26 [uncultured Caudovirales phage]
MIIKIIKNIIFIWLIKTTSLIFESQTKNQTMKQSTKDTITVTIIIILALLGDSIFNQL